MNAKQQEAISILSNVTTINKQYNYDNQVIAETLSGDWGIDTDGRKYPTRSPLAKITKYSIPNEASSVVVSKNSLFWGDESGVIIPYVVVIKDFKMCGIQSAIGYANLIGEKLNIEVVI